MDSQRLIWSSIKLETDCFVDYYDFCGLVKKKNYAET